jgi:hypothetical protein
MTTILRIAVVCTALLLTFGCRGGKEEAEDKTTTTADAQEAPEPDYITVQHILIGFKGSLPGKRITRTQEEAATLAAEILARAQGGENFDALVKEYTDDVYPGIYEMANFTAQADENRKIFPRARMVAAFGDVGFPLAVDGIGMAAFDTEKSPYGWHIIKRVR